MLVATLAVGGWAPGSETPAAAPPGDDAARSFVAELQAQGLTADQPACTEVEGGATTCYARAVDPPTLVVVGTASGPDGPWVIERFLPPVPLSPAELDATLGPPAAAWVAQPSPPTYDALAVAAAALLATNRPFGPELFDGSSTAALDPQAALGALTTYPGSDATVIEILNALALRDLGTPSPPPAQIQPAIDLPTNPPADAATDPRFDTCREANASGYGDYVRGDDPEYDYYDDRDNDGIVCEW